MKESAVFQGLECHSDTRLCHSSRGLMLVRHTGRDLVP